MDRKYALALWGAVFAGSAGFGAGYAAFSESAVEQTFAAPALASTSLPTDSIAVASFNIQIMGESKTSKRAVLATLAKVIRKYQVVAVQEVKDKSETAAAKLLEAVNANGARYALSLSPRTGLQPDDTSSQEQYAYYYDTQQLEIEGARLFDDATDSFQREPYLARFTARAGGFSFVLINIHTRPEAAVEEIGALHAVFQWAMEQYPGEDDFIALGDYNAGCNYAKPAQLGALQLRAAPYTWAVPDDADTNLATQACAYDRIVFRNGTQADFTGEWGVDRAFTDKAVSDHWPVWARFYTARDGAVLPPAEAVDRANCCRVCKTSRACGDACIPAASACHQPPGCACDR